MKHIAPRDWRIGCGLTQAAVAARLGIAGRNPARQVNRYETGQAVAPAEVIEMYRLVSEGVVTAESMHAVRLAFVRRQASSEGLLAESVA